MIISGMSVPWQPLPIQYADYAHWHRDMLQKGVMEQQLVYWRKQLDGVIPHLELPTDRPRYSSVHFFLPLRPPIQTFNGSLVEFQIPQEVSKKLITLFRKNGVSEFMGLLASYAIFLYRYSKQEDLIIGTVSAGRSHPDLESLIGFFVNTLPIRLKLSGSQSFLSVLKQVY